MPKGKASGDKSCYAASIGRSSVEMPRGIGADEKRHLRDEWNPGDIIQNHATKLRRHPMNFSLSHIAVEPVLAILAGILILVAPRFLNYFVAVYLIVIGIMGLMSAR